MFRSLVLLLSLRPILGDLHHGNNNLLILFLIVAMLYAWRQGLRRRRGAAPGAGDLVQGDAGAFLRLLRLQAIVADGGLGRSWGMGIFLLIVPSLVIGPAVQRRVPGDVVAPHDHARSCVKGATSPQEINQSMVGVSDAAADRADARARAATTLTST